jgi:hypothetical protein
MTTKASTTTTSSNTTMQNPQDYLIQRAMEISAKLASLEPIPDLDHNTVIEDEESDDDTCTTEEDTTSEESSAGKRPKSSSSSSSSSQQRRRGSKKNQSNIKNAKTAVSTTRTTTVVTATTTKATATRKKKSVWFARNVEDGKVNRTTHCYVENSSLSVDELWYSQSELQAIHNASLVSVAFHQQKSQDDYIKAIVGLAFSFEKEICTKEMKVQFKKDITKYSDACRGFEASIVQITSSLRQAHIDTVLDTQDELEKKAGGLLVSKQSSKNVELLRRKSRETSRPSRQLALMLAEHDTFEAMKATLLPWHNK